MAAFDFPSDPSPGFQVTNPNTGVTYEWDDVSSTWQVIGSAAADMYVTDVELQAEASIRETNDSRHDTALENLAIENSDQEARITILEQKPDPVIPDPLTYQIGTDKVMRAGEPSIELVDSEGYYSNVKFQGLGGISVSSDLQSIIIDGSGIDAGGGVDDIQLGLLFHSETVSIKVNGSVDKGVEIPSANRYAAGVLTSADWNKLSNWGDIDDYYTKDEIDDQFRYRGLGYRYTFDSANGQVQPRAGKFNTDSVYANEITFISLGDEDYDGKSARWAVPGDKIELVSPASGASFSYLVVQGGGGTYSVEFEGTTSSAAVQTEVITPLNATIYTFYIFPTHINAADYYTKTQANDRFLNKKSGTAQTLGSNVKYTGLMDQPESLVNKQYIENNFLQTNQGVFQVCDRITKFTQTVDYSGPITSTLNIAHKGYVDSQIQGVLNSVGQLGYATISYVNDEVDKVALSFATEQAEPNIYYGDYAPTGELKNGDHWFDSMNLRLNIYSQGAWINPDRNDGKDLEDRITALEARLAQLEGN